MKKALILCLMAISFTAHADSNPKINSLICWKGSASLSLDANTGMLVTSDFFSEAIGLQKVNTRSKATEVGRFLDDALPRSFSYFITGNGRILNDGNTQSVPLDFKITFISGNQKLAELKSGDKVIQLDGCYEAQDRSSDKDPEFKFIFRN